MGMESKDKNKELEKRIELGTEGKMYWAGWKIETTLGMHKAMVKFPKAVIYSGVG